MQETGFRATALRFRPQTFSGLIGQEHVSLTLINAIKNKRISHGYLFSGPRGVGKTSAARIFAKSLNCEHGPTDSPCGVCVNCVEIAESRSLDVYEIDGASNRGVEQIRDLRESVRFSPARSRYKIYIIDEVHMLTNEAFNALLKTLEEPPPYIVFIFATTEASKVKITIRSRCQHYRFKRIKTREIQARLRAVCEADNIIAEEDALFLIARAADGSLRDSQSLFDQVASYAPEGIRVEDVKEITGSIDTATLYDFLTFLLEKDPAELLTRIADLDDEGVDFSAFVQGLSEVLRNLLLLATGADESTLELTPEDCADLKAFIDPSSADGFSADDAVLLLNILADLMARMHEARNPRRVFEMAIFQLINFRNLVRPEEVVSRLEGLERRLRGEIQPGGGVVRRPGPGMPIELAPPEAPRPAAQRPTASPEAPRPAAQPPTAQAGPRSGPEAQGGPPDATRTPESPAHQPASDRVEAPRSATQPATAQADPRPGPEAQGGPPDAARTPQGPAHQLASARVEAPRPVTRPPSSPSTTGDPLADLRELARLVEGSNPFLSRVLEEIARAEINGNHLILWFLPRSRYHRSSIESSYSETVLAYFAERYNRSFNLECRFTDEGPSQDPATRDEPEPEPEKLEPVLDPPPAPRAEVAPEPQESPESDSPKKKTKHPTQPAPEPDLSQACGQSGLLKSVLSSFGGKIIFDEAVDDQPSGLPAGDWHEDEIDLDD